MSVRLKRYTVKRFHVNGVLVWSVWDRIQEGWVAHHTTRHRARLEAWARNRTVFSSSAGSGETA